MTAADITYLLHVGETVYIRKGGISDEQRKACLEQLAARWEWLGRERWDLLADLACPSLPLVRREELGAEYAAWTATATELLASWVTWSEVFPDLTCADRQAVAAELAADRAAELLYALLNGEGE